MVDVTDVLEGTMADSERALLEPLTHLAEGKEGHKKILEAAESLIQHRRSLDEVIGQALEGILELESEKHRLEEELQQIEDQREALKQVVEEVADALDSQLEQVTSSLKSVLGLLSGAAASVEELQSRLSSLVKRLEQVTPASWPEGTGHQSYAEFKVWEQEEGAVQSEGGEERASLSEAVSAPEASSETEPMREAIEMVRQTGQPEALSEMKEEEPISMGRPKPQELLPGQAFFSKTEEDTEASPEAERGSETEGEDRSTWWLPFRR